MRLFLKKKRVFTFLAVLMGVPLCGVLFWLFASHGELTPGLGLVIALICFAGGRLCAWIMVKWIEAMYGPME